MKILWIGNSFTYYNDLPAIFDALVKSEDLDIVTQSVTKGGWYLHRHADPTDIKGAEVAEQLRQSWDTVILQEQSFHPIRDRQDYIRSAQSIIDKCGNADIYLYQSWSYEDGSEKLQSTELTFDEMHHALRDSFHAAAQALDVRIAPVGDAHYICCKEYPEITLYRPDSFHPSIFLSYLAALTFFKTIYGKMPQSDYLPEDVDVQSARIIKNIVANMGE